MICQLFLKPKDEVVVPEYSFLMYRIYANIVDAKVKFAKEINYKISNIEILKKVTKNRSIKHNFVECGVWKGIYLVFLQKLIETYNMENFKIYGFDTFKGMSLPTKEDKTPKVSLTPKEREKTYDAIISTNPEVAKVFTDEGWWGSVDKDAKTLLLNKAEEIYAANPELGREGALLQAAGAAPTTTGQPVPKEDPYSGKTIK